MAHPDLTIVSDRIPLEDIPRIVHSYSWTLKMVLHLISLKCVRELAIISSDKIRKVLKKFKGNHSDPRQKTIMESVDTVVKMWDALPHKKYQEWQFFDNDISSLIGQLEIQRNTTWVDTSSYPLVRAYRLFRKRVDDILPSEFTQESSVIGSDLSHIEYCCRILIAHLVGEYITSLCNSGKIIHGKHCKGSLFQSTKGPMKDEDGKSFHDLFELVTVSRIGPAHPFEFTKISEVYSKPEFLDRIDRIFRLFIFPEFSTLTNEVFVRIKCFAISIYTLHFYSKIVLMLLLGLMILIIDVTIL